MSTETEPTAVNGPEIYSLNIQWSIGKIFFSYV